MPRINKRQTQIENKRKHKASLKSREKKETLGSRTEPNLERLPANIAEKKTFLIFCEGKNTEPTYFCGFKLTSASINILGEGYNTKSLVERAILLRTEDADKGIYFDEVWCVFDKDDFSNADFNDAIAIAANNDISIAYSNQAFEYWLLLHFNDHQGGKLDRKLCAKKLNAHLAKFQVYFDFDGSKTIDSRLFELMTSKEKSTDKMTRVERAIARSKLICSRLNGKNPATEESSTKVHLLVEEIMKHL
jgi:hypothetical protein